MTSEQRKALDHPRRALMSLVASLAGLPETEAAAAATLTLDTVKQLRLLELVLTAQVHP